MLFKQSSFLGLRLILLVALAIGLMVIEHRQAHTQRLHAGLSAVVAPLQYLVAKPVEWVDWLRDSVANRQALIEENANLRMQALVLQGKLQRILSLQTENKQLRALLQSTSFIGEKYSVAQLLAVSTGPDIAQFVIDKGQEDGVYTGQPVLDANGVMGQIVQVGPLTSRVMLITDTRSAIPVQIDRTGMRGIALGTGARRHLALIDITNAADIRVGDILTTSGLGMHYPEGYPVGIVTRVADEPGEPFLTIAVAPSAHINQSRQVLLVWQTSQKLLDEARKELASINQPEALA